LVSKFALESDIGGMANFETTTLGRFHRPFQRRFFCRAGYGFWQRWPSWPWLRALSHLAAAIWGG